MNLQECPDCIKCERADKTACGITNTYVYHCKGRPLKLRNNFNVTVSVSGSQTARAEQPLQAIILSDLSTCPRICRICGNDGQHSSGDSLDICGRAVRENEENTQEHRESWRTCM